MKKNDKQRLFEVMGRLDKTFKSSLNEGFEEKDDDSTQTPAITPNTEQAPNFQLPAEPTEEPTGFPTEEPVELSPEEKLAELTAKVDEMYQLLHGESEEAEIPAEEPIDTDGIEMENLQEWNFDKKKGEKKDDKEEGDDDASEKKHEDSETPAEEKEEDLDETKKVPVAAIAKVGK